MPTNLVYPIYKRIIFSPQKKNQKLITKMGYPFSYKNKYKRVIFPTIPEGVVRQI